MSAVFSAPPASSSFPRGSELRLASQPFLWRAALWTGSGAAGFVAVALSNPAASADAEASLVVLLRGMALIKACLALAALGLAHWRFAQPVSSPVAVGYIVGVSALIAASVLIGSLSFIPFAAVLFHVGLFGLLILGWREGRNGWGTPLFRS